jgi:hypothetical protein
MRLKTSHGTYVVTGQNGELLHLPERLGKDSESVWNVAPPPVLASGLMEAAVTEGPLAPSILVVLADGLVAFRRNGLYLCADPAFPDVRFDRAHVREWECFVIEMIDGTVFRPSSGDPIAQSVSPSRPTLIETLAGYQIMGPAADSDLVTVTWPDHSKEPITRYSMPDGSWIVDVDGTRHPDQPFLVYWFYPFNAKVHVWRLDRSGRRMFGYDLSDLEAKAFLSSRRAMGPEVATRLYLLALRDGDGEALALLSDELQAAAEAGSAEPLHALLYHPLALPPARVRSFALRGFDMLRAAIRARTAQADDHLKRFTVDALAGALGRLDPEVSGLRSEQLQGELDFRDLFANAESFHADMAALPVALHCQTLASITSVMEGVASSVTIGILLRPKRRRIEFHYVSSIGGVRQRVMDAIGYAYYALRTNAANVWQRLAALDGEGEDRMIRFEVGDLPLQHGRSVSFERRVGDTTTLLVPDSYYFVFKGFREGWFNGSVPSWSQKAPRFVWRGSTTGADQLTRDALAQTPRVRLCELGRRLGPNVDFGITGVVQARSDSDAIDIERSLKDQGLWREHMPQHIMGANKFLLEIDGNANSWGFFAKLLMGCCILKVESPFEQWFYQRLQPWVHYVPVAPDLSDLPERVSWCLKHDKACRKIADAARQLAESMTFEAEMTAAANTFVSAAGVLTDKSSLSGPKQKLLISNFDDIYNIYHIFVGEIDAIWKETRGDPNFSILLKNYAESAPGSWRIELLKSIYREVYIGDLPAEVIFDDVREIKSWTYGMVDNQTFSQIDPSSFHIEMADRVKDKYNLRDSVGDRVVYIERGRSRIIFDFKTKLLLSQILIEKCVAHNILIDIVNFDYATFQNQVDVLSRAKVLLSCHGAANTNIFLLPKNATLLEVNFRKFWFCDPVCNRHKSGELSYRTDCGGPLTWKDTFHKAEYHNLAQLYGIGYREFEVKDAENFLNENPIEVENIYVDGDKIFEEIRTVMGRDK